MNRLPIFFGLFGACAWLCAGLAFGDERANRVPWLTGAEISTMFSGQDLAGIYPNEQLWSERILADGSTEYREGAKHWIGKWWVTEREFCFEYPPPGLGGCFRVVKTSKNCFELYESTGEHGSADEPPDILNAWNGRMWKSSEATTCERQTS